MLNLYAYHPDPESLLGYENRVKYIPALAYKLAAHADRRISYLEPTIMKDPFYIYNYAQHIVRGRWPEAEPILMKDGKYAYFYAKFIIKGRWPEAEPYIKQDSDWWGDYEDYFHRRGEL